MKKLIASILGVSLAASATTAFAGGPVVVEEEGQPEVVAEKPRSGWIVPVIIGLVVICAVACGDDDDDERDEPTTPTTPTTTPTTIPE